MDFPGRTGSTDTRPKAIRVIGHVRSLTTLLALLVGACATGPELPPVVRYSPELLAHLQYKAVLVAGDGSLPVFDNATRAMQGRLIAGGLEPRDIHRLSADREAVARDDEHLAKLDRVLAAVAGLHATSGQGCLVYATSHGAYDRGLLFTASRSFVTPAALDRALAQGCGNAPTLVIVSGCFSGSFAKAPMARSNRVILTASSDNRTSFGCGAGRELTVYDDCLLHALDSASLWPELHRDTVACVERQEAALRTSPSLPQAYFGSDIDGLPVPGSKRPSR